jgi:hypothetical protein
MTITLSHSCFNAALFAVPVTVLEGFKEINGLKEGDL